MRRTLFALVSVIVSACAVPAPPPSKLEYRLQADPCTAGDVGVTPGTVHVMSSTGRCTGVVISGTEVLTAGHCVDQAEWAYVDFGAGAVFATHAAVNGPYGEDVALLSVAVPDGVSMADVGEPPAPGASVTFSGYGCDKAGRTRRAVTRPNEIFGVSARRYTGCACPGDSGGPVFYDGAVIGIMTHTNQVDRTWVTETSVVPYLRGLLAWLKLQDPP